MWTSGALAYLFNASSDDLPGDRPAPSWAAGRLVERAAQTDDDRTLVASVRAGDGRALDTIYVAHAPALWRFATRLTGSRTEAEEIVHDVFAALWEHRNTWTVRQSIAAYLFGAVRNRVIDRQRHTSLAVVTENRQAWLPVPPGMGGAPLAPDVAAEHAELAKAVHDAVARLPERRRTALLLRHVNDLSYAEIGAALGVSEKAAFILVSRARDALRPVFERFATER